MLTGVSPRRVGAKPHYGTPLSPSHPRENLKRKEVQVGAKREVVVGGKNVAVTGTKKVADTKRPYRVTNALIKN